MNATGDVCARGLLQCDCCGTRMAYSYAVAHGRKYPYYVPECAAKGWAACPAKRLPAQRIEDSILAQLRIDFVAADMPEALPLTLHIFAARAEHERPHDLTKNEGEHGHGQREFEPINFVSAGEAGGLTRTMETRIGTRRLKPQTERGGNRDK